MIFYGIPYRRLLDKEVSKKSSPISKFVAFFETKTNTTALYDLRNIPFGRSELQEELHIAESLIDKGVLTTFRPVTPLIDEPRFFLWSATCNVPSKHRVGGVSSHSDGLALRGALAEGLERFLWFTQDVHFIKPVHATTEQIKKMGAHVAPERFSSFSPKEREQNPKRTLHRDNVFLWTQASSLVTGKNTYIPAQTISPSLSQKEQVIRTATTCGLATWPTQAGARLAGIQELIERDAYMIMWLNQLTLQRVNVASLQAKSPTLDALVKKCQQYRLKVHAIYMATDAPTHAVCVCIEDESGLPPTLAVGLKSHRSLPHAVERALLEALRGRVGGRNYFESGPWDKNIPVEKIGHRERMHYWSMPEHNTNLQFLIAGEEKEYFFDAPWEEDTEEEHLARLVEWCRDSEYECLSVSLGNTPLNPTPWHVEMITIPELQPIHLTEWSRHLGGSRLKSVPEKMGLTPRALPFIDAPHPFS